MNNLSSILEKKLLPLANKMSSQKYLKAVSSSFRECNINRVS